MLRSARLYSVREFSRDQGINARSSSSTRPPERGERSDLATACGRSVLLSRRRPRGRSPSRVSTLGLRSALLRRPVRPGVRRVRQHPGRALPPPRDRARRRRARLAASRYPRSAPWGGGARHMQCASRRVACASAAPPGSIMRRLGCGLSGAELSIVSSARRTPAAPRRHMRTHGGHMDSPRS